jgi:FkbH-like protein
MSVTGRPDRRTLALALSRAAPQILPRWSQTLFDPELIRKHQVPGLEGQSAEILMSGYLQPLFRMLVGYLMTGKASYLDAYHDERLRYAPHRSVEGGPPMHADPVVRASYFSEVLATAEADCRSALGSKESEFEGLLGPVFAELHDPLRQPPQGDPLRLLAVGDCLMGEIRLALPRCLAEHGIPFDMRTLYFSAALGSSISSDQVIAAVREGKPDAVAFSFFSYEALAPYSALMREADRLSSTDRQARVDALMDAAGQFLEEVRAVTEAPFLVHNSAGLPLTPIRRRLPLLATHSKGREDVLRRIAAAVDAWVEAQPNTILIDERKLVAKEGARELGAPLLPSSATRQSMFHALRFGPALAGSYTGILRARALTRKTKLLLLDFDNTLWQGVMADEEVVQYRERQELLRRLKNEGMLLAAVSKNTESNIRWDETLLQPDDFAVRKINWNLKVQSIREIAEEMDLGLDSFVFLDDNAAERELVRTQLPQVERLDPDDPWSWRAMEFLRDFPNTKDTEVARRRTEMYREQAERRRASESAVDYPTLMRSLGLWVRFGPAEKRDLTRVGELIQRTNQFNTTTIRYDRSQIDEFKENEAIWVAELGDKFGTHGLVMVVLVRRDGSEVEFDSIVMSCRAMGYGLEQWMLARVMQKEKAKVFRGRFLPTDRNSPAAGLYSSCGFVEDESGVWCRAAEPPLVAPDWIQEEAR